MLFWAFLIEYLHWKQSAILEAKLFSNRNQQQDPYSVMKITTQSQKRTFMSFLTRIMLIILEDSTKFIDEIQKKNIIMLIARRCHLSITIKARRPYRDIQRWHAITVRRYSNSLSKLTQKLKNSEGGYIRTGLKRKYVPSLGSFLQYSVKIFNIQFNWLFW